MPLLENEVLTLSPKDADFIKQLTVFCIICCGAMLIPFVNIFAAAVNLVLMLILLYKYWSFVNPAKAETTPGSAIGFLCIPFYGFYWSFIAHVSLSRHYENCAFAGEMPTIPARLYCIGLCASAVFGFLAAVAFLAEGDGALVLQIFYGVVGIITAAFEIWWLVLMKKIFVSLAGCE